MSVVIKPLRNLLSRTLGLDTPANVAVTALDNSMDITAGCAVDCRAGRSQLVIELNCLHTVFFGDTKRRILATIFIHNPDEAIGIYEPRVPIYHRCFYWYPSSVLTLNATFDSF